MMNLIDTIEKVEVGFFSKIEKNIIVKNFSNILINLSTEQIIHLGEKEIRLDDEILYLIEEEEVNVLNTNFTIDEVFNLKGKDQYILLREENRSFIIWRNDDNDIMGTIFSNGERDEDFEKGRSLNIRF